MKKFYLLTKTLLVMALLCVGASNAWGVVNTDSKGRKQYVWNLGCEAKASVGGTGFTDYYLKASQSAYGDYSAVYGTEGNYDIVKAHIYGGRCIFANTAADSDKGGGASLGYNEGFLEFYAPISGYVSLAGCYDDRPKIYDVTQSTNSGSDKYLSVSVGDKVQIYTNLSSNGGHGIEKIVLTESCYGETITNPSISGERNSLTITPGEASWTIGGVEREANNGNHTYAFSRTSIPAVSTYYTTDGTTPTSSSTKYKRAIDASSALIVKCISIGYGGYESEVVSSPWYALSPVMTATRWDYTALKAAQTNGGFATDGTVWVKNMTDDSGNSRLKFNTTLDSNPTELGNDVVAFKAGVAGQVYMRLVDYCATVTVYDGTTPTPFPGSSSGEGTSQKNAGYHGGNTYYTYATFQVEAGKEYYIYRTATSGSSPNAGIYFIDFQPTGNNTTTALTEETTWNFKTQKDILTTYNGITKDNMFFGTGLTEYYTGSTLYAYRLAFNAQGNTSTGANLVSFKVPANVCGTITVNPSCYNDDVVLYDGSNVVQTFVQSDHMNDVVVPVYTTSETTFYLYTNAVTPHTSTGIFSVAWTPITSVSGTITPAGWATLYTPYAIDFSGTGLTAYTATCTDNVVTLAPVTTVPANTGVVLEGDAGDYSIPVIANSETAKGDLKGSATEATAWDAYDGYTLYALTLVDDGANVQFNPVTSGSIAAGKAFLKINGGVSYARAMKVVFAGDVTGINEAAATTQATLKEGKFVENGKLVIFKNGKKFNANGAQVK